MSNATETENWYDVGTDSSSMTAQGSKSTAGDSYVFTETESSTDDFVLSKNVPGVMSGSGTDSNSLTTSMSGYTAPGGFAYTSYSENVNTQDETGSVTYDGIVTPYSQQVVTTDELKIVVSGGPPASTATLTSTNTATTTGSNDGANYTEFDFAGEGDSAGEQVATQVGTSPTASAEHMGTSPDSLDTGTGLLSAMGGADLHAMSFTGTEIKPAANPSGNGVWLEESFEYGSQPTNWQSHPSGIGYRRNSPGITTTTGAGSSASTTTGPPFAGNAPTMDSGLSDGGGGEELTRLSNFVGGGNENTTSTQPGPTPRATQLLNRTGANLNSTVRTSGVGDDGYYHFDDPFTEFIANGMWAPFVGNRNGSNGAFGTGRGQGRAASSHSGIGSERSGYAPTAPTPHGGPMLGMGSANPVPGSQIAAPQEALAAGAVAGGAILAGANGNGAGQAQGLASVGPGSAAPQNAAANGQSVLEAALDPSSSDPQGALAKAKDLAWRTAVAATVSVAVVFAVTALATALIAFEMPVAAGVLLVGMTAIGIYFMVQQLSGIVTGVDPTTGDPLSPYERVARTFELVISLAAGGRGAKSGSGAGKWFGGKFRPWRPGGAASGKPAHIDIGGEGRYPDAINVNPGISGAQGPPPLTSGPTQVGGAGAAGRPIPNLVRAPGENLPFANRSIDTVTLENAPIRPRTVSEIARVIKPGGDIRLVGANTPEVLAAHLRIADAVGGKVYQTVVGGAVYTNIIVPRR